MFAKSIGLMAVIGAAVLTACAPEVETLPVSAKLDPMPLRIPVVGDTKVWKVGDEQLTRVTVAVNGASQNVEGSDGCSFTEDPGFAPGPVWAGCPDFTDGSQSYVKSGEIYPLAIGQKVSYAVKGQNVSGDNWETTRNCTVLETVKVTVPAGSFDTFHVSCNDQFTNRDFYVSPDLGTTVLIRRHRKSRNETKMFEMVSFTPGT
ncbi:MAG: hypothetical protein AAFP68_14370 [Pseudomonadota bacterium]